MRAMLWMGGVVLTLAALIGAGHLWAGSRPKQPETPQTRIGLLNLTYVIKNCDRYKDFQEAIREIVEPFQRKDANLRRQMDKLRAEAQKLAAERNSSEQHARRAQQQHNALEGRARQLQRELEDNALAVKEKLGRCSDEEMEALFRAVHKAVKRYAASHDLDLVLHYNDAVVVADYYSSPNVARKLTSAALLPLTSTPGMDISKDISDLLNDELRNNP